MKPRAFYDIILKRGCIMSKVPFRKFHALRHTSALHALAQGISLEQIQKQLDHANIKTTMMYLRGEDEDRARAYRKRSLSATLKEQANERRNFDF